VEIRRLTRADLPAIQKLRLSAPSHLGVSQAKMTTHLRFVPHEFAEYYLTGSDRYVGIGVFNEGRLISFMTSIVMADAWYIQMIMSSKTERASKFNGIDVCTDWMIDFAERRGITSFWYSVPLRYEKAHRTAWRKVTKLLSRYDRADVLTVRKYTRCNDPLIWKYLMSEMVLPIDMLIRKNTLKPDEEVIR
jgi:hypothetical protein